MLFAILQKYDFSSKSQPDDRLRFPPDGCLRYCKSTIFQANHNSLEVVIRILLLFAILQKYDFSSKSQHCLTPVGGLYVVCDTAKVRFFKQITTAVLLNPFSYLLFAILQKYDFSSKSQQISADIADLSSCLRYCKSTIFQANHNTTSRALPLKRLFAILQKYDFSSKSQQVLEFADATTSCLRYCKSTIFQANHNGHAADACTHPVVCDTAKVRFFKQITTYCRVCSADVLLFAILQKYDFSSKSQH